jgi:NAD(P)-dependent dehydrogenase (short-subunit alcohol dehydrogenase family)
LVEMDGSRVWLVTGAGRGIGRALADAALAAGDRVVATTRRADVLVDLATQHPSTLEVAILDVRDRRAVHDAVDRAAQRWGRLDVLVNNAGYGLVGAVEELTEPDARAILDTDFFGALWASQAAVPHMRRQGHGHIVQISTIGAVGSMPTMGMYNAAKWALEGFSEALAGEVGQFGIRVTIAELGGFATDWAGASMQFAEPIAAYDGLRTDLFGTPTVPWVVPDEADPTTDAPPHLAAAAVLAHVDADDGPLRLLVGDDAPHYVSLALGSRRDDYARDPRFSWPGRPGDQEG